MAMQEVSQPLPPLGYLQDLFRPNFMRGELTWKVAKGGKKAGALAGCPTSKGYVRVCIDTKEYPAHRILYALYHQADPGIHHQVDHENRDRSDNRVANLRLATRAQNRQNSHGTRKGLKGAFRNTSKTSRIMKPWVSSIMVEGVNHFLGMFETEEEAHAAYAKASVIYHGEFGRVA